MAAPSRPSCCDFQTLPPEIFEQIANELVLTHHYDEVLALSGACRHWRSFLRSFRLSPRSSFLFINEIPEHLDEGSAVKDDQRIVLPSSPSFYQLILFYLQLDQEDWQQPDRGYFTFDFPDPVPHPSPGHLKQWLFLGRQENELIREVVARFQPLAGQASTSQFHSDLPHRSHSVHEWEMKSGIILPRMLRKLYQRVDGGLFDNTINFFSLNQISATSCRPIDAYVADLDRHIIGKLKTSYKDEKLQAEIEAYCALSLEQKDKYGVNNNLSLRSIGLPSRSTSRMIEVAGHLEHDHYVNSYLQFAFAQSGAHYCDYRLRYFFNTQSSRLPIQMTRMVNLDCSYISSRRLASENHLAVLWDHEDESGNGGWWNKSFTKLPESFTTWLYVLLQDLGNALGAYDQP